MKGGRGSREEDIWLQLVACVRKKKESCRFAPHLLLPTFLLSPPHVAVQRFELSSKDAKGRHPSNASL
jgi:hypothetical protein